MKRIVIALAFTSALAPVAGFAQSGVEARLDALQREIERLKTEVSRLKAQAVPDTPPPPVAATAELSVPHAALLARPESSPNSIFGYGEFNYHRFRDANRGSRADLRRFVVGFGHRFNDRLSFQSEVEIDHAIVSASDRGEAELEQAYVNYRFSDSLNVQGGLFLIPLGILNQTHEPPTYYGVERNEVETRIIPTTWRELGAGINGLVGQGFKYDLGVTTGFNAGKLDDRTTGIRSGHQEGQIADAHDLSVYGALNYRAPGLLVGGGVFTGNTGQNGQSNARLRGVSGKLVLWDVHAKYSVNGFDFQALYAGGTLGDAQKINAAILATAAAPFAVPRKLRGWYGQAAYHLWRQGDFDLAPFVRLERYEIQQQEDIANGLLQDPGNLERIRTVGFNFRIHPQVVLKSEVRRYSTDRTKDRFSVGLGYMF